MNRATPTSVRFSQQPTTGLPALREALTVFRRIVRGERVHVAILTVIIMHTGTSQQFIPFPLSLEPL